MNPRGIKLTSMAISEQELWYLRHGEANLVFPGGGGGDPTDDLCMGGGGIEAGCVCRFSKWEFHHLPLNPKETEKSNPKPTRPADSCFHRLRRQLPVWVCACVNGGVVVYWQKQAKELSHRLIKKCWFWSHKSRELREVQILDPFCKHLHQSKSELRCNFNNLDQNEKVLGFLTPKNLNTIPISVTCREKCNNIHFSIKNSDSNA